LIFRWQLCKVKKAIDRTLSAQAKNFQQLTSGVGTGDVFMVNVIFHCTSTYHIFIATFMSFRYYHEDRVILSLDSYLWNTTKDHMVYSDETFWECVEVISDNSAKGISEQVDAILRKHTPSTLHIFNCGYESSRAYFCQASSGVSIELTDEGLGSYNLKEIWCDAVRFEFKRVSRLWLLAPSLSLDDDFPFPKCLIELETLFEDAVHLQSYLCAANRLFGYSPKAIHTVTYFDRYFTSENTLPSCFERMFLSCLTETLSGYDFAVKSHPSENKHLRRMKYKKEIKFYEDEIVPWELIVLNQPNNKMIIVSINSSPLITTKLLPAVSKNAVLSISVLRMIEDYIDPSELYILPLIEKYNAIHPESPVLSATNPYELQKVINAYLGSQNTISQYMGLFEGNETLWLKNEYLKYSRVFGNLVQRTELTFVFDDGDFSTEYLFSNLLDPVVKETIWVADGKSRSVCSVTIVCAAHLTLNTQEIIFVCQDEMVKAHKNQVVDSDSNTSVITCNQDILGVAVCLHHVVPIFPFDYVNV
jgi:hypothetical protein